MLAPICQICFEWWIWSICTPWKRSIIYQRQERGRKEEDCSLREGGGSLREANGNTGDFDWSWLWLDWFAVQFEVLCLNWTGLKARCSDWNQTEVWSSSRGLDCTVLFIRSVWLHCTKKTIHSPKWERVYAGGLCRVRNRINLCRFASSLPWFTF